MFYKIIGGCQGVFYSRYTFLILTHEPIEVEENYINVFENIKLKEKFNEIRRKWIC